MQVVVNDHQKRGGHTFDAPALHIPEQSDRLFRFKVITYSVSG
jgi:hypothetical protein